MLAVSSTAHVVVVFVSLGQVIIIHLSFSLKLSRRNAIIIAFVISLFVIYQDLLLVFFI